MLFGDFSFKVKIKKKLLTFLSKLHIINVPQLIGNFSPFIFNSSYKGYNLGGLYLLSCLQFPL